MEKSTQEKHPPPTPAQPTSSRSSSRRTSGANTREPLPTPPPDPRLMHPSANNENIFQYPAVTASGVSALPAAYQSLLSYAEREKEFYQTLNEAIAKDCPHGHVHSHPKAPSEITKSFTTPQILGQQCNCEKMREECEQFIDPLNNRLNVSLSAALAAYGAVDQLTRLYAIWDRYLDVERKLWQRKECIRYVNLLQKKIQTTEKDTKLEDPELVPSIALLDTILATGNNASLKRSQLKQQRERSKSVMVEDFTGSLGKVTEVKSPVSNSYVQPLLRRQSTYSEGKSKVSKWTKVKAAFKWERANVPVLSESNKDISNGVGLTPVNNEVARYLRVPSLPCGGGSSADSVLSSSSGHFLSETGTPGTISSASSMDDIENSGRNTMRRDSSKSDSRSETRKFEDADLAAVCSVPSAEGSFDIDQQKLLRSDSSKSAPTSSMAKSPSNKSIRRSRVVSDFEALPEDVIADIKNTPTRRLKPPPSPLDLNLKQDLNDLDCLYSPHLLKSPKDGTQSLNRLKKISSPGNSSVPSSPSRHSDFFAEFESEDISSGDFSEPSSPSRKTFQQKHDEINQKYQMLRAKLNIEFEEKRREWEKLKSNPNTARVIPLLSSVPKSEEHSPNSAYNASLSAKRLEENLTPDFKKKLRKWRVKKQNSMQSSPSQQTIPPTSSPHSPNKENKEATNEPKAKIDWNLWKTGQIKLEGQGLTPLPDQKDLPEDFQKKLEQWNKIKRGGSIAGGGGDSLKRAGKHNESTKKSSDDDRGSCAEKEKRADKHKPHEKDKLEKLAKLKAIVGDHPAKPKEIEVKTSAGVMKFEGISRKFTRKLYEWEKARGIGPESSTFALLHPGYCPIDVGRISKDNNKTDNSPTLSRSLSLDSVSPNMSLPTAMSQQASSLSLNDVNELKSELDGVSSSDQLGESDLRKYEEPEAVMVEVEDHIVETASPLITATTRVEKQTPVYKYEEVACNDICNSRRIQSYESHTNLAPLLAALKRFDELFMLLKRASPEIAERAEVHRCQACISLVRKIYPYYTENLIKANVLNSISDVQSELSRIAQLSQKSPLDEACCQEILEERNKEYKEEFDGLYESLELLRQSIQGGKNRYPRDIVPDINITTDDAIENSTQPFAAFDTTCKDPLSTTLEATDELSASQMENDTETTTTTNTTHTTVQRSFSNATANGSTGKKKLRLRKMGSRQNSKTESSNSSDDDALSNIEMLRRLKRKNFRFKQRSFDDDYRRAEEPSTISEDVHFVLKVKPGHTIEQCGSLSGLDKQFRKTQSAKEPFPQFSFEEQQAPSPVVEIMNPALNSNAPNVFVKTKRKVFTTVEEPNAIDGIAVIARDVECHSQQSLDTVEPKSNEVIPFTVNIKETDVPTIAAKVVTPTNSASVKQPLKPKHKSMSQPDLRLFSVFESCEERRCHSADSVKAKRVCADVRQPLATDSFRVINKSCGTLTRDGSGRGTPKRMEIRFKKNPELAYIQHPKFNATRMAKKIETKIAKSNSGGSVEHHIPTLPTVNSRCTPPYMKPERKSLTPTVYDIKMEFPVEVLPAPLKSAPTTPLQETQPFGKPCTPLSERALRLKKAKEDFLQGTMPRSKPSFKRRDEIVRSDNWEQYRRSDQSLSSTTTTGGDDINMNLLKSLSVDTIRGGGTTSATSGLEDTPAQSDAGTDQEIAVGVYDTLPRAVTRSGKISSKLGFATLASKFRRGKVKGKNKDPTAGSGDSALSALCRQTLFADAIAIPIQLQHESVVKSQSTPQARASANPSSAQASYLNKSQSEQYVKKESYV